MNRRDFLKFMSLGALGMYFNTLDTEASKLETAEPMIYKRFLQFSEYVKRPATEIIVIHHTDKIDPLSKAPLDEDSTVERVHKWHIEHNGWAGIGYHYLIRKTGMIEQGRLPDMVGAHVFGHNNNSIGICLAGSFHTGVAKPTKEQIQSLKELTLWLCRKYDIKPSRQTILGHRDLNSDTTCPGDNLYCRLNEIREYCRGNSR